MSTQVCVRDGLARRRRLVERYVESHPPAGLEHAELQRGVLEYLRRGGKCLRGAVSLLSCGLFGGSEEDALPLAAAVEVFHAWTLVHDDIIDRDATRRGGPTLHRHFEKQSRRGHDAPWFGLSLALLAGDIQQAWSFELLTALERQCGAALALAAVREMSSRAIPQLIEGEALDIELSGTPFGEIRQADILRMMELKTAVLYRFAGTAGAWIGRRTSQPHPDVERLGAFLGGVGLAFQLKDDLLGVTSSADKTGKDTDSDIREGKRTLIAALAHERADAAGRALLHEALGNPRASTAQVQSVREMFRETGAVAAVEQRAEALIDEALQGLRGLAHSPCRDELEALALYLVRRES
jgi:geranylgeranyl diphosphate synthase, type I